MAAVVRCSPATPGSRYAPSPRSSRPSRRRWHCGRPRCRATPDDLDGWAGPSFGTLGGIDRRWAIDGTATADNTTYLQVQAYPLDSPVCRLERARDLSQIRLPAFPVPHRSAATAVWWNLTTDCNSLGQRMHLEELFGEGYRTGWWEGDPDKQWDNRLTASQGVERMCQCFPDYSRDDANGGKYGITTLSTFPGAAWDASPFTTGADPGGGRAERTRAATGLTYSPRAARAA